MSSIFGGGSSTTVVQAPTPLPPPTMPDPNNPATIAAGTQQARQAALRSGRQSTMMTTPASRTIAGGALGATKDTGSAPAPAAGGAAPAYSNTSL